MLHTVARSQWYHYEGGWLEEKVRGGCRPEDVLPESLLMFAESMHSTRAVCDDNLLACYLCTFQMCDDAQMSRVKY